MKASLTAKTAIKKKISETTLALELVGGFIKDSIP